MKDHVKDKIKSSRTYDEAVAIIDDYMDYYNNDKYQWELAKLAPNEFYEFCITGVYPLEVEKIPETPVPEKDPSELGKR